MWESLLGMLGGGGGGGGGGGLVGMAGKAASSVPQGLAELGRLVSSPAPPLVTPPSEGGGGMPSLIQPKDATASGQDALMKFVQALMARKAGNVAFPNPAVGGGKYGVSPLDYGISTFGGGEATSASTL